MQGLPRFPLTVSQPLATVLSMTNTDTTNTDQAVEIHEAVHQAAAQAAHVFQTALVGFRLVDASPADLRAVSNVMKALVAAQTGEQV